MTTAALLAFAGTVLLAGPRLLGSARIGLAPRPVIWLWQALAAGVVAAAVLAGLTLLIPTTALGGGLAEVLHACAMTVAGVYASPGQLPGVLLGTLLAVGIPARLLTVGARLVARERAARRELRAAIALSAHPDPSLGASVLDSPQAAAFCVPGRRGTVVVTSGALRALSEAELAGVLAHERAHLRGRHQAAVTAFRILERAFPQARLFGAGRAETERLVELLADDSAARRVDPISVASALVTLAGMPSPSVALAAAAGSGAVRVRRLLAPTPPLRRMRTLAAGLAAVAAVATPVALAAWPLLAAVSSGLCTVPDAMGWS
jgi:Zn-dependent protease with chaperone function